MGEITKIQWATSTGGPWLGCSIVCTHCAACYAKGLAETRLEPLFRKAYKAAGFADWATMPMWGERAPRVLTKGFWDDARRINAKHERAGTRGMWFPSMIDWLDLMPAGIVDQDGARLEPAVVLGDFLTLMQCTPHLTWLLLTKRPQNWRSRMIEVAAHGPEPAATVAHCWLGNKPLPNVWIGVSIGVNEREALHIPARVHFLSAEPLLGPLETGVAGFDWVIVGNESRGKGIGRLPHNSEEGFANEARAIKAQCRAANVRFFMKQMPINGHTMGDSAAFPPELRVREFPTL